MVPHRHAASLGELFQCPPSSTYRQDVERIRNEVNRILLRKDQMLLRQMSRVNLAGDKAVFWSHLIVNLLRKQNSPETMQSFIKYAIREKMLESYTKGKDISEVLRDNSMSTLLLVTCTQTEGRQYLLNTLQPCLQKLQPIIKDCEIDPARIAPEKAAQNQANLHQACRTLLDAIIQSKDQLPLPLRSMCALIRKEVIRLWQISVSYSQHNADPARKRHKSYQYLPSSQGTLSTTHTGSSPVPLNPDEPLDESEPRFYRFSNMDLPQFDESIVGNDFADDLTKHLMSILERSTHSPLGTATPSPAASTGRFSIESPVAPSFLSRSQNSRPASKAMGGRVRSVGLPSTHLSEPEEFNAIEKVMGTLLFIRFIIPAMTSPETFGLPPEPSSRARRGYVLCAKVIAALCNGIQFGSKESYMSCMNSFLRESRPKVRPYLQHICLSGDSRSLRRSHKGTPSLHIHPDMNLTDYLTQHLESAFSIDDFDTRCSLNLGENLGLDSRPSYTSASSSESMDFRSLRNPRRADGSGEDDLLLFVYQNIDTLISDCASRSQDTDNWAEIEQDLRELRKMLGNFSPELEYLYYLKTGALCVSTDTTAVASSTQSGSIEHDDLLTPLTSHSTDALSLKSPFPALSLGKALRSLGGRNNGISPLF
ncbi:hypothetical protein IWQ61_000810 [Dispira simplex]|nr:hypothetical protein IWQ61_000810 [Dispira simplex]